MIVGFIYMFSEKPSNKSHYLYCGLNRPERLTIWLVYFTNWRNLVKRANLQKNEEEYFELYFKEIHSRYYKKVASTGSYLTSDRLIFNFLLSRANENVRLVLGSLNPYNLIGFVSAIRSQIELNALINKYITDKSYHEEFIKLNEDRTKVGELKTVINVNTLVRNLNNKNEILPYEDIYNDLSRWLHPNPSLIGFYAQVKKGEKAQPWGRPRLNFYFDKTVANTDEANNWFNNYLWNFLTFMEHFIILIDDLKNEFYIDEKEKEDHLIFAHSAFLEKNKKRILDAANAAHREGRDVQEAINEVYTKILNGK